MTVCVRRTTPFISSTSWDQISRWVKIKVQSPVPLLFAGEATILKFFPFHQYQVVTLSLKAINDLCYEP